MHILIAPDKFKGCLDADEAAARIADAARNVFPDATIEVLPMTDGGDGFTRLLARRFDAELVSLRVTDAYGSPRETGYALVEAQKLPPEILETLDLRAHGKIALIDAASACGLAEVPLDERDPWAASSRGVGELIAAATGRGVTAIILGLGGVATNDLGLGALEALGLETSDTRRGRISPVTPIALHKEVRFGGYLWPNVPELIVACDVANPLLGPTGATFGFGRQKGLLATDLNPMERLLGALAKKICEHTETPRLRIGEPGAGAAGGLGFALRCAFDARFVPGAKLVAEAFELKKRIHAADLVITGEGAFDLSSLNGKLPGLVVELAAAAHKPVLVLAGSTDAAATEALSTRHPAAKAVAVSHPDWSLDEARTHFGVAAELTLREHAASLRR